MEKLNTHCMSKAVAALMAAATVMPLFTSDAIAHSAIKREIARRAALAADADLALTAGRTAYAEGDYQEAVNQYRRALELLPKAPNTESRRKAYQNHLGDAAVMLSRESVGKGDLNKARNLVEEVLVEDPTHSHAKQQQSYLADPVRTNQALTAEHGENVEAVRGHLYKAQGAFDLADFDQAEREYHKVLRIDKYNRAARRGLEQVHRAKSDYYLSAYDDNRAALLAQVDAAWEQTVPSLVSETEILSNNQSATLNQAALIKEKLDTLIVPEFRMSEFTVTDAIQLLRQYAYDLDVDSQPSDRGIDFYVSSPRIGASEDAETLVDKNPGQKMISEIDLTNVPLRVVLEQLVKEASLRYKVTDYVVEILPLGGEEELLQRRYTVPADFRQRLTSGGGGGGEASDDPFAAGVSELGAVNRPALASVQDLLQQAGVSFSEGASAALIGGTTLVVTNTPASLDGIEQIVLEIIKKEPKMIKITTKFVEVSQENTDELGFDWSLNPVGFGGASLDTASTFLNGGSSTISSNTGNATGNTRIGESTALRSGDFAITGNTIDSIINNPTRNAQTNEAAPGILSLTGVYGGGAVNMIMRGLQQRKGTDIMTAPSVMTRSTQEATIEVVREFIYPTEYEAPEIPQQVDTNSGAGFPVTPSTPTAFEMRKTGVALSVEPTLGDNNYTIDLTFTPQIVEFEGFINYGSPIQAIGTESAIAGSTAASEPITLTDNRIEMPVFSSRKVQSAITIYDGHTVAIGGLMREDVQTVRDQVPILGDLPLIGRLFKSEAENRIKSNLIIFVTVDVIDASGQRFNDRNIGTDVVADSDTGVLPGL